MTLFIYLPIQQTFRKSILLLASVVNKNSNNNKRNKTKPLTTPETYSV